eukprot:CAMPEP_0170517002 /NCGR_PEP_ID=MMETSP0209-20121228/3098_1 /TAXON_ID=665100 ORGANISM="Litonotus pictus, Strain P1" /NCGR_SAMPLE_ID=MMETSP0209 /ASSEMBLY_ACC=CAM_ASM_000301 /LENGTH=440 /DNA_ID=CAMNT_0010802121 /DNA_START=152 /DNA_END=1474 /DNA_ORIENTATION=-
MNRNTVCKKIGERKKKNKEDSCEDLLKEKEEIEKAIEQGAKIVEELWKTLISKYGKVGNIVHETVPVHDDEKFNKIEKTWGTPNKMKIDGKPGSAHHHEILRWIDGYDPERGAKLAGHRGYFLKQYGVLLNQALLQYGLNFMLKNGYTALQTPVFMKEEIMSETCQLSDFKESLYKVSASDDPNADPYYLIATSEQPISALYRNEWLEKTELPMKYSGISSCFRKEAGSSGKDMWGIFRVHQFEKIEQFCITSPEESWKVHNEMLEISEKFYQSLELPYQVINIVSGALNDAAAKKFDLEAWFPGYDNFRELVSISNCTDYQSRSLDIRLRTEKSKKDGKEKKEYVHMLNGTLCASERTMCCILENYQTPEGVKVPTVLQPYVGTDFIPYKKELLPGFKEEKEKEKEVKKEKAKLKHTDNKIQQEKEKKENGDKEIKIEK